MVESGERPQKAWVVDRGIIETCGANSVGVPGKDPDLEVGRFDLYSAECLPRRSAPVVAHQPTAAHPEQVHARQLVEVVTGLGQRRQAAPVPLRRDRLRHVLPGRSRRPALLEPLVLQARELGDARLDLDGQGRERSFLREDR